MKNTLYVIATFCAVLSQSAIAHPGHDHSHWMSNPIHWITAAAFAAVITMIVRIVLKHKADKQDI